jgi:dipeptide transport system ATP-binding protein
MADLLTIEDLHVSFRSEDGETTPVRGVTLNVAAGETMALVGESGSGKSVTSLAVMGLLPQPAGRISGGRVLFRAKSGAVVDLATADARTMRALRGREIAMIFQEPMTSLNPVLSVGEQIAESVRLHLRLDGRAAMKRAEEMLDLVEIPDARRRVHDYPHQMSGGMRQRVMIALAMACNPALLIADEPTTALDVTIQAQILDLLLTLQRERGMALVLITHNIGVVAETARRVAVMYAGQVMEEQAADSLFAAPQHPYTAALLAALPERANGGRLVTIPGVVPGPYDRPDGCLFSPRCAYATGYSRTVRPALREWRGGHIRCHYPLGDNEREAHRAADGPVAEVGAQA